MRALVLAPQPFYSERGTPISEENLLRVMSARGWSVDLLTYAEGEDIDLPGLTIHRIATIPGIAHVPPGFSFRKLISDAVMTVKAVRMAATGRYDLVHALEEAVFMAAALRRLFGIPYVYDMDSILSEQLIDRFPPLAHAGAALRYFEEVAVSGSLGVVAVCESLADMARGLSSSPLVGQLEDRSQLGPARSGAQSLRDLVGGERTIALYVGNLEHYQGIDLLLEGFSVAAPDAPELALVVIGGSGDNVARYRSLADGLGLNGSVHLLGPRPVEHLRNYLEQADLLVSPRISGTNTPMKIYSFLDAGVPLLATRLPTHLQVLDEEISCLFEPDPASLGRALVELCRNPVRRGEMARAALRRVRHRYSRRAYESRAHRLLGEIENRVEEAWRGSPPRTAKPVRPVIPPADIPWHGTIRRFAADLRPDRSAAGIRARAWPA